VLIPVAVLVAGLVVLTVAADWFVAGAARLAVAFRLSAVVVGAVIIGFGTSAPELVVSVLAAAQGSLDIAIGNIVGSNLFNLLAVLGGAALVAPGELAVPRAALAVDLPVALLVTLVALPALASGLVLTRWEGAVLLGAYGGYVTVVVLTGTASPAAGVARLAFLATLAVCVLLFAAVALRQRAAWRAP
jgi:cation:H+ antiporter